MLGIKNNTGSINLAVISGFVILILCYLFRTAIPIVKYFFIVLVFVFALYITITKWRILAGSFRAYFRTFYIVLILLAVLILSYLFSQKLYLEIFKITINGVILMVIYYFLMIIVRTRDEFDFLIHRFVVFTVYFALLISLIGFFNLYIRALPEVLTAKGFSRFVAHEAARIDYNFALLPVFFSMIALFYPFKGKPVLPKKYLNYLFINIFTLTVLFSGSRRGLAALAVLCIILIAIRIRSLFAKRYVSSRRVNRLSIYFLSTTSLICILLLIFLFGTSNGFKIRAFKTLGLRSTDYIKTSLTGTFHSYSTLFNSNLSYYDFYNMVWKWQEFDPLDPDSGWGTRDHETVYPLTGRNVEIVPDLAKGYYLDRNSNSETWNNNAYSFTRIAQDSLAVKESYNASVYCYVSEDFNGSWAKILAEGEDFRGLLSDEYNLSRKGTWQKLSLFGTVAGQYGIYLYFAYEGQDSFVDLEGHVIFAVPEFNYLEHDPRDPRTWAKRSFKLYTDLPGDLGLPDSTYGYSMDSTCNATSWKGNAYSYTNIAELEVRDGDRIMASVYSYVSDDFNGSWVRLSCESTFGNSHDVYSMDEKGTWQRLNLEIESREGMARLYLYFAKNDVSDFSGLEGNVIFANPRYFVIRSDSSSETLSELQTHNRRETFKAYALMPVITSLMIAVQDSDDLDPFRSWLARVYSEDTTYYGYNARITVDTVQTNFLSQRVDRWQFGWQLYTREYNFVKKLLGGGFDHLNWYGSFFHGKKTLSDWPHNPILSVLLYSGILGLGIYILFLLMVLRYFFRYIREYGILFLFFLLTFSFAFFSGTTPFDPPVLGFLVMIPFCIHHYNRNAIEALTDNGTAKKQ